METIQSERLIESRDRNIADFYISDSFIIWAQRHAENRAQNRPISIFPNSGRFSHLFRSDLTINLGPLKTLNQEVQAELIKKSEIVAAQRYTAGITSMFWQLSKEASQRLSRDQIDSLPEDEKLVVKTAITFIK